MCQLNIPYMQQLGLNTIRVYSVDNSAYDNCYEEKRLIL